MVGVFSFINVRIYILSKTSVLATVSEDSSKIGTEPDSLEAAEGETVVTIVAAWRIDVAWECIQEVGVGRRTSRMRPMPTAVADVVDVAVAQEDAPAMDKSQW